MQHLNCYSNLQFKRSNFKVLSEDFAEELEEPRLIPVVRSRVNCFLDIRNTNKYFHHYCCVTSISKYI